MKQELKGLFLNKLTRKKVLMNRIQEQIVKTSNMFSCHLRRKNSTIGQAYIILLNYYNYIREFYSRDRYPTHISQYHLIAVHREERCYVTNQAKYFQLKM
jgi:hypothetical protein